MRAVIVVDMQENFTHKKNPYLVESVIKSQKEAIFSEIKKDSALVFVCYSGHGNILEELKKDIPCRGSIIKKRYDSAFTEGKLDAFLDKRNIDELVMMGQNSNACVMDSVEDALEMGYHVEIYPNTTMGTNEATHNHALMRYNELCVLVPSPSYNF